MHHANTWRFLCPGVERVQGEMEEHFMQECEASLVSVTLFWEKFHTAPWQHDVGRLVRCWLHFGLPNQSWKAGCLLQCWVNKAANSDQSSSALAFTYRKQMGQKILILSSIVVACLHLSPAHVGSLLSMACWETLLYSLHPVSYESLS